MKLVIYNGSPRGLKSNSKLLIDNFIEGFNSVSDGSSYEVFYLQKWTENSKHIEAFQSADIVLIVFPLYTDAMPGLVKYFFESLEKFKTNEKNPAMGFVVQSGFPEVHHSRFVEKYLEKLTRRLHSEYLGTVIKGGVEGIQIMPPNMTKELFNDFKNLGKYFAENKKFDQKIINKFAKREKLSSFRRVFFKLLSITGLPNFYWNSQLKKNKVYDKRFARPFAE